MELPPDIGTIIFQIVAKIGACIHKHFELFDEFLIRWVQAPVIGAGMSSTQISQ
jgi:hypothetical protein